MLPRHKQHTYTHTLTELFITVHSERKIDRLREGQSKVRQLVKVESDREIDREREREGPN